MIHFRRRPACSGDCEHRHRGKAEVKFATVAEGAASTTATAAVAGTAVCSGAAIVRGWDARLVMRSSLSEGAASASVVRLTNGTIAGARCLARKVAAGCLKAVNWFSRLHATLRWTGSCSQHFVAAGKLAGVTTTAATVDTDFPAADSVVNNTRHLQQRQSFSHHLLMWAAQANQPCPRRAPRSWVLSSRAVGGGGTRQL
jgi:hypothetical protein